VELLYIVQLGSSVPIYNNIGKYQFLFLCFETKMERTKCYMAVEYCYSIVIILVAALFQIFNISISKIISFAGVLIGFIIVFLVPCIIHLQCIENEKNYLAKVEAAKL